MRVPLQKEELDRLSGLLAESLYEAQDYESAAIIHAQYRNEHPEAVRILCKGYHFAEAMRIVCPTYLNSSKRKQLMLQYLGSTFGAVRSS